MKKIISLCLALFLIVTAALTLIACDEENKENNNNNNNNNGTGSTNTADRIPLDYLPTDGFDKTTFNILEWTAGGQTDIGMRWVPWEEADVDNKDGDMLGSAVFDRNAWVEENYNVVITKEYCSVDSVNGALPYTTVVRNDANSEGNAYQLYILRTVNIVQLVEEGLFADMNEYSEYIHTDEPWWVQDSVESFTLGSHLYVAASEMLLRDKGGTAALFFNQALAADYTDLPNFFELAENNEWTLEEMINACSIVASSLDGDDLMNSAQDMWGCTGGDDPVYYLYNGFNFKFANIDGGGYLNYNFGYNDDSITAMKRIFDEFMYSDFFMNTMTVGSAFLEEGQDLFVDGQSLFKSGLIKDTALGLKNMVQLYGILPHPMYDLDQENYSSLVWEHHDSILGIPEFATDKEMCAIVLEAMSWESYYSVCPVFYDTILLNRAAKDSESKAMLQIILDTRSYDPGLYWDNNSGLHGNDGLLRLSKTGSSDIASLWAKYKDTIDGNVDDVNEWIDSKE